MEKKIIQEPISGVPWLTVAGAKTKEFRELAVSEGFHKLDVEDCSHQRRLGKAIDRDGYTFMIVKTIRHDLKGSGRLAFENIDFFIKPDKLITVEEHAEQLFAKAASRFSGSARSDILYLVYVILHEIVDGYLLALDAVGETADALEAEVIRNPSAQTLQRIFHAKRSLIDFRRNAASMREAVNALLRSPRIEKDIELLNYFRDIYEHNVQVIEFIETYRDLLSSALEVYLSAVSGRTNEIMKVLTVYGTVALPFLVIPGLYGMNVRLPLQESPQAFWILISGMTIVWIVILLYFRRKKWF